jgi:hypothetical protein
LKLSCQALPAEGCHYSQLRYTLPLTDELIATPLIAKPHFSRDDIDYYFDAFAARAPISLLITYAFAYFIRPPATPMLSVFDAIFAFSPPVSFDFSY